MKFKNQLSKCGSLGEIKVNSGKGYFHEHEIGRGQRPNNISKIDFFQFSTNATPRKY